MELLNNKTENTSNTPLSNPKVEHLRQTFVR